MNILKYLTAFVLALTFFASCGSDANGDGTTDGTDSTGTSGELVDETLSKEAPEPADINIHDAPVDLTKVEEASKKFCDCAEKHLAPGGDRSGMTDCMGGSQEDFIKSHTEGMGEEAEQKFQVELKNKAKESCEKYAIMVFGE